MNGIKSLKWSDQSDLGSTCFLPDGRVVAEIISARWDRWIIKVNGRARGLWVGKRAAQEACERIYEEERPGRWIAVLEQSGGAVDNFGNQLDIRGYPAKRGFWDRFVEKVWGS